MQVRVHNKNVHPFKQTIAEVEYVIPAQSYIKLDVEEADRLVKAFSPISVDYDGNPLPESYKMLEIDQGDLKAQRISAENKARPGGYVCQACGYNAMNQWELNGHIQDRHKDQWEDPEEAKQSLKREQANARKKA